MNDNQAIHSPAESKRNSGDATSDQGSIKTVSILILAVVIWADTLLDLVPILWNESSTHSLLTGGGDNCFDDAMSAGAPTTRFVLYRLIQNNLEPLQCPGQMLTNLEYILEHEPDFPGCRKRWVVNHVLNITERAWMLDALLAKGYTSEDLILRPPDLKKVAAAPADKWLDLVLADSEARNAILEHGSQLGVPWILPFDHSNFITMEAWKSIVKAANMAERKGAKYFRVATYQVGSEQSSREVNAMSTLKDLRGGGALLDGDQIAFRSDAPERFSEDVAQAPANKADLFERVCGEKSAAPKKCLCSAAGPSSCGYTVQLWPYPCQGTDIQKVFKDAEYKSTLEKQAHEKLLKDIGRAVDGHEIV